MKFDVVTILWPQFLIVLIEQIAIFSFSFSIVDFILKK